MMNSPINTTRTSKKASTMLAPKCEYTQKNMKRLMTQAGFKTYETVPTIFSRGGSTEGDDVVYMGINGVPFYFMRGVDIDLPVPLREFAKQNKLLD